MTDPVEDEGDVARPVAEGVLEEHVEDVAEGRGRGSGQHGLRRARPPEGSLSGPDVARPGRPRLVHDVPQVDGRLVAVGLAGEGEEGGDGRLELVGLGEQLLEDRLAVGPGRELLGLDGGAHGGDRCAELVRGIGREGAFPGHGGADPLPGGVQRLSHLVQLGHAGGFHLDGEVTGTELGGGRAEVLDRSGEADGERGGASLPHTVTFQEGEYGSFSHMLERISFVPRC